MSTEPKNKKKILFDLAIGLFLLIPLVIQSGCKDRDQSLEDAQESVSEAKQELAETKEDIQADARISLESVEWKSFKAQSEEKIQKNEIRISELREKMKKSGNTMDAVYEKKIENLAQKNNELKSKLMSYEKEQSNWESFKKEFDHDMDELGAAFKGLTTDDK